MQNPKPSLLVLLGPTGVGKTELSINLAEYFNTPIISADSRQLYQEMKIGAATPSEQQLSRVKHYFIATQKVLDNYNAGLYEVDVLTLLDKLFLEHKIALMVGGSMMYIDAVCNGFDDLPSVPEEIRKHWNNFYKQNGLEAIQQKLFEEDPDYYAKVDIYNPQRLLHALEICTVAGCPFSSLLKGEKKERPFNVIKIGLNRPRVELYDRINRRVDEMVKDGLLEEAKELYPFRQYNALNTVGYKELFDYFDGKISLEMAINLIKQNSRRYAKRQLTWFNKDSTINWFQPHQEKEIIEFINHTIQ
jgi:tRNA dimethylallyltransferase